MRSAARALALHTQTGRRLSAARLGCVALTLLTLTLFVAGLAPRYAQLASPSTAVRTDLAQLGLSVQGYASFLVALEILIVGAFALTATLLFWYRSDEPMVLFVALMLITFGTMNGIFVRSPWILAAQHPGVAVACRALTWGAHVQLVLFFLLFPDGRFVPRGTRWLAPLLALALGAWIFSPQTDFLADDLSAALLRPATIPLIGALTALQIYRYLRVSDTVQRRQTGWVVFGVAGSALGFLEAIFAGYGFTPGISPTVNATAIQLVGTLVAGLALLVMPISFGVAVARHRLFEIDFFLNRALVYGALSAGIVFGYALVVGGLGQLSRTRGSFLVSLVATSLIAILFQPLRERLQHGVNRLMYGERDDPAAVIVQLARRLDAQLAPDTALLAISETVATTLKLPYAAIALQRGGVMTVASEYPASGAEVRGRADARALQALPLSYQGESIGELRLALRPGEADFGPADRRLLADLAPQAGVAVHAVRLAIDLQRSREELVLAREEERRRLRRDLHDGLGPRLAALTLRLDTAHGLLADDPRAAALLTDLAERMAEAVTDIRRLVYALRPPALDDLGLVGALQQAADSYRPGGLQIDVDVHGAGGSLLPSLPAAVEVAAYRIAQEALTNVVKHAGARCCTIRLTLEDASRALLVEVDGDGSGITADRTVGIGLRSMRERAEELGGTCSMVPLPGRGTRVHVRLPCSPIATDTGEGR